jgi:hypothetical protein
MTNQLMLEGKLPKHHGKHTNMLCRQNPELYNAKAGGTYHYHLNRVLASTKSCLLQLAGLISA